MAHDSTMEARRGELDPPRWPQEGSKRGLEGSKGHPGTPQRPQGEPLGRPNGGQEAPGGPQEAAKMAREGSGGSQNGQKCEMQKR